MQEQEHKTIQESYNNLREENTEKDKNSRRRKTTKNTQNYKKKNPTHWHFIVGIETS